MNTTQTTPEKAAEPGAGGRKKAWRWAALAVVAVVVVVVVAAALATSGESSAELASRGASGDDGATLNERGAPPDSLTSQGYAAEENKGSVSATGAGQVGLPGPAGHHPQGHQDRQGRPGDR